MPPIAVIDFETTGMSPSQGAGIEVAIDAGGAAGGGRFSKSDENRGVVPPFITELTGISNAMLPGCAQC